MEKKKNTRQSKNPYLVFTPCTLPLFMLVVTLIASGLLYILVTELAPTSEERGICDLYTYFGNTSATVHLAMGDGGLPGPGKEQPPCRVDLYSRLFQDPKPGDLVLYLSDGENRSKYVFKDFIGGELEYVGLGESVGTITYIDIAGNEKINIGDMLKLSDLSPDTPYTLEIVWLSTKETIAVSSFRTPPS